MKTLRLAVPLIAGLAILAVQASLGARAQDYPTRPITIVVPFPAGGNIDAVVRGRMPRSARLCRAALVGCPRSRHSTATR